MVNIKNLSKYIKLVKSIPTTTKPTYNSYYTRKSKKFYYKAKLAISSAPKIPPKKIKSSSKVKKQALQQQKIPIIFSYIDGSTNKLQTVDRVAYNFNVNFLQQPLAEKIMHQKKLKINVQFLLANDIITDNGYHTHVGKWFYTVNKRTGEWELLVETEGILSSSAKSKGKRNEIIDPNRLINGKPKVQYVIPIRIDYVNINASFLDLLYEIKRPYTHIINTNTSYLNYFKKQIIKQKFSLNGLELFLNKFNISPDLLPILKNLMKKDPIFAYFFNPPTNPIDIGTFNAQRINNYNNSTMNSRMSILIQQAIPIAKARKKLIRLRTASSASRGKNRVCGALPFILMLEELYRNYDHDESMSTIYEEYTSANSDEITPDDAQNNKIVRNNFFDRIILGLTWLFAGTNRNVITTTQTETQVIEPITVENPITPAQERELSIDTNTYSQATFGAISKGFEKPTNWPNLPAKSINNKLKGKDIDPNKAESSKKSSAFRRTDEKDPPSRKGKEKAPDKNENPKKDSNDNDDDSNNII